jgi:hypothetical protein
MVTKTFQDWGFSASNPAPEEKNLGPKESPSQIKKSEEKAAAILSKRLMP